MHLPRFKLLQPQSLDEAIEMAHTHGPSARFGAGGTDLFVRMKYRVTLPEFVVSLKQVPVPPPSVDDEGALRIGALMTLRDIIGSDAIAARSPVLAEAAYSVASEQVRSMATLGGNLCLETRCLYYNQAHDFQYVTPCFKRGGDRCYLVPKGKRCWAVFMGDTAPALVAREALVEIASSARLRTIPLEQFYSNESLSPLTLSPGEVLSAIVIPARKKRAGEAFAKLSVRGGLDFAIVSAAAVLEIEDDGRCSRASLVIGSIGPAPMRAAQTEAQLTGQLLTKELLHEASRSAANEIRPIMHHEHSASYLRHSITEITHEALSLAFDRLHI